MTPDDFRGQFAVSRETLARLEAYVGLLKRWNTRINLVSPATIESVWQRHIADSAQLLDLAPKDTPTWIDLGAGAGLPGLAVAALAAEKAPTLKVTLVESDGRKAAFLDTAAREMGLGVAIEACRIETLAPRGFDVVSARALAPLTKLCELAHRFASGETVFLFPKGARLDSELTLAAADWHIRAERIVSLTDPDATILKILELDPKT
jgi:16S rRNA (guanine527-N7)-methyltransferase